MPEPVKIIRAGLDDALDILELSRKTFIETYYEVSDKKQVLKFLDTHLTIQKVKEDLINPSILFYIARKGLQSVGVLKLVENVPAKGLENKKCLLLDKLYVLKDYHGKKIGSELMELVKVHASENEYEVIWLQVWQKNTAAIKFYQHAGFVIYDTCLFEYYEEPENDFLLKFELHN